MNPHIPAGRAYVHAKCSQITEVSGDDFRNVNNPLWDHGYTICANCKEAFKIEEFAWVDTQEKLTDYQTRYRSQLSPAVRFWSSASGWMTCLLLGFLVGASTFLIFGCCLGGLVAAVGVVAGHFIHSGIISPLMYRLAFGNVDPRIFK